MASVFACREKVLLEKIKLLEQELNHVTSEMDQLRSCLKSRSSLKELGSFLSSSAPLKLTIFLGDHVCDSLLSLQRTRRWAAELQSYKSQLEERDAQVSHRHGD